MFASRLLLGGHGNLGVAFAHLRHGVSDLGLNDIALAVTVLAWVGSGLLHDGTPEMGSPLIQSCAFMAGYMLMIVKGFGFLLLCKQEDDRKMLHLATVDSLTGLLNRHAFFEQALALRVHPAGAAAV